MSEEERKEIATIISSILTSTTRRMTIKQLNNDFIQTEGYRIPHEKFGCYNLEQFLRTLKSKVQVNGSGVHAEVQVLITEKTAHINELIAKQKARNPKIQRLPKRRNFYQHNNRSFTNCTNNSHNEKSEKIESKISSSNGPEQTVTETSTNDKGAVPKQTIRRQTSRIEEIYFSDEESRRNVRVPENIQENLRKLISKYPDGIMCSSILEYYRKEYRKALTYSEYGYRSIAEMCADLRNIFNVVQLDRSDVKLFNKNLPIPEDTLNVVKKLQLLKIKATRETSTDGTALPVGEVKDIMRQIHAENVPPDVVMSGTELERQWIDPGTNEQDCIDVNIAEIYDPSKFWMILKMCSNRLNAMMDNMQLFYGIHHSELYVPFFALKKGMYVACIYNREYHRARIVNISQEEENTITAYFIDYGTVSVISTNTVCYLHNQYAELPEQAIRTRLAGIYPRTENEQWSRAGAMRFLSLVMQKDLVAQIIKIDEERKILDVVLADTTEDEDFFINDALVSMGYAQFTFEDQIPAAPAKIVPIVRYIHLFPTHLELENSLVPTATQAMYMHQAGMRIEQMYPHYFKDAKTGLPITISQTFSDKAKDLSVDSLIEEAYLKKTAEGDDDQISLDNDEGERAISGAGNSSGAISCSWGDVIELDDGGDEIEQYSIEEGEYRSPSNVNKSCETDFALYSPEFYEEKATQTNISAFTQTDACETPNAGAKRSNTTTNTNRSFRTNSPTKFSGTGEEIPLNPPTGGEFKKPLKPPPGYEHVIPRNTAVTYNYNANPSHRHPYNCITNQTYINLPVLYPYSTQQYAYNPYASHYYEQYMQHLLQLRSRLSFQQQNFLQSLNCKSNTQEASDHPLFSQNNQDYLNRLPPQSTKYQHTPAGSHTYESQPTQTVTNEDHIRVNPETIPDHVAAESIPPTITPCRSDIVHDVFLKEHVTSGIMKPSNELLEKGEELERNISITLDDNKDFVENKEEDIATEQLEQNLFIADNIQDNENVKTEINPKALETKQTHLQVINSNNELSELDSVYEECIPCESPTITKEDDDYKTKLITSMSIGKLKMHVINHEDDFYFLLAELSKKIFGKTLTALHLRKLIVGSPYIISVVDIRLKTNPELKKDLLIYKLITEKEQTVDAIPIKYLKDLTKMITAADEDMENINVLLKGVDYFLSRLNLERPYF
ncbi:putative P granule organization [Trypoxylus dichotomus]